MADARFPNEDDSPARRLGFRRLAIAIGVPYFGWWAFLGIGSFIGYGRYQERLNSPTVKSDTELKVLLDGARLTSHNIEMSILWGLIVPLLALGVVATARWVYRGFNP